MDCSELTHDVILSFLDHTLERSGSLDVRTHLQGCATCRARQEDVRALVRGIRAVHEGSKPLVPQALEDALLVEFERIAAAAREQRLEAPADLEEAAGARSYDEPVEARFSWSRRQVFGALGAAALFLAALVGALGNWLTEPLPESNGAGSAPVAKSGEGTTGGVVRLEDVVGVPSEAGAGDLARERTGALTAGDRSVGRPSAREGAADAKSDAHAAGQIAGATGSGHGAAEPRGVTTFDGQRPSAGALVPTTGSGAPAEANSAAPRGVAAGSPADSAPYGERAKEGGFGGRTFARSPVRPLPEDRLDVRRAPTPAVPGRTAGLLQDPVRKSESASAGDPAAGAKPRPQDPSRPAGDVNGDGRLDIADSMLITRAILRGDSQVDLSHADANQDGKVDIADAMHISNRVVGGTQ